MLGLSAPGGSALFTLRRQCIPVYIVVVVVVERTSHCRHSDTCAACTFVKVFEPIALWLESRDLCVYVCKTLAARRLLLLYARPTDQPNTHTHTHSNTYVRELTLAGFAPMQYNNTRELFSHYMGVCVYADLHANVFYPCVFVCVHLALILCEKNLLHLRMPPTAEIIV